MTARALGPAEFIEEAGSGGMLEVLSSDLALERAPDGRVKGFARMATEHRALADKLVATVQAAHDLEHHEPVDLHGSLSRLSGGDRILGSFAPSVSAAYPAVIKNWFPQPSHIDLSAAYPAVIGPRATGRRRQVLSAAYPAVIGA